MIKITSFNKNPDQKVVNSIGIEFEGSFSSPVIETMRAIKKVINDKGEEIARLMFNDKLIELCRAGIADIGRDGSVRTTDGHLDSEACEIRSQIHYTNTSLAKCLNGFNYLVKNGSYTFNQSVGLHFHVSVNDKALGLLASQDFYNSWIEVFRKTASEVYNERASNRYTQVVNLDRMNSKKIARYLSTDCAKYQPINYSAWREHKTIEFRLYGGSSASLEGLAQIINKTIKLINETATKKESSRRQYYFGERQADTVISYSL